MGSDRDYTYIQFPITLLQGMFVNTYETLWDIIYFGVHKYAMTIQVDQSRVCLQLLYLFLNDQQSLPKNIVQWILTSGNEPQKDLLFRPDGTPSLDNYSGFVEAVHNSGLDGDITVHYRLNAAIKHFGLGVSPYEILKALLSLEAANVAMPMVKIESLFALLRDKAKFKELWFIQDRLIPFCAYIAVRSIVGKNVYYLTNKQFIITRMLGYNSTRDLPVEETELLKKYYRSRTRQDKIIVQLEVMYGVLCYGNGLRGLLVSLNLDRDSLGKIASELTSKNAANRIKKEKLEVFNKYKKAPKPTVSKEPSLSVITGDLFNFNKKQQLN